MIESGQSSSREDSEVLARLIARVRARVLGDIERRAVCAEHLLVARNEPDAEEILVADCLGEMTY